MLLSSDHSVRLNALPKSEDDKVVLSFLLSFPVATPPDKKSPDEKEVDKEAEGTEVAAHDESETSLFELFLDL